MDTEQDPYNIMAGFFYAHMGWIFFRTPADRDFKCAPDLAKDPLILWQNKYNLPILIAVGFGLPTLIGWTVGRPFGGFLLFPSPALRQGLTLAQCRQPRIMCRARQRPDRA